MRERTIGFVGLGAMGEPMVARLLDAGFRVVSYVNRSREAMERLKPKGLVEVSNATELGERSDVVMCCVFDEPQNDQALRGPGGVMAALQPGAVILLMSTISPGYCRKLAAEAAQRDVAVLDCPLSGLVQGAVDGTLSLMIGGAEDHIAGCEDVLAPLGTVFRCGDIGSGQVMKLANNAISISTFSLVLEVRDLVSSYGMDLDNFMAILNQSTGSSVVSERFPMPTGRLKMMGMPEKDVSTCLKLAEELGVSLPMVQQCFDAGKAALEDASG
ncbi:MAG: NAD(P)-dependent oxidoreductase [Gammaproteobacteria bacterium]|nr:NAD(P)-dependent oxidoreductase [Gammaproteobacteria bacterium]MYF11501.1 NAD(P)-dependent oxidoreductase [Gammaproteobacteria bacterium]MYF51320.1 NAD(P)-dependent oxidoreductase [Gammaproteobacteria bacterium]MYG14648.1 NAD(P)-dependent oxidoreductase [Gammaproteobacteria bacterium]